MKAELSKLGEAPRAYVEKIKPLHVVVNSGEGMDSAEAMNVDE